MSNFSIPQSMNPVRYQASLGGNVKSTNIDNVHEQFQIELGIVKKVFYRKGTLLFSIINRGSSVSVVGNDTSSATASAPIPVETFGRNSDGKVFGGYRPVKVGSKIAVGYVNGERSAPIVLGVYPDNDESYEIVSPVSFETGEDSDKSVEDIALGSKEITASQNIIYQSGKGDILKTFNGKSLLYINANGSNYMDDINYAYDQIADTRDGNMNPVTPRETRAQSWLLVHEDNPENEETNGHRTRFYVNKNGEFQMVMFSPNNDGDNNLVVFTASKDDGFKLRKQFDTDDLDGSEEYVQFSIGSGNSAVLQSVDKDNASEISMLPNGLQLTTPNNGAMTFNGRSLETMFGSISSAVDAAKAAGDTATIAASAGAIAQSAASDAASQALAASQAGEDAKSAAVNAQAAGEDAKAQAKDTRDRIIYYSSISNEKDVAIPGKYIIINTDTYIANGTIKTAHIGDAAITNAKIANLAVGTAQLEDAAITRAKIGNLAVGTAQIEDAAITDAKVGDLSADHLKAGTIDFSVISGIHINASEIDVGKIVADQIFVNGLGDISKNLGTVTSGKITGTNVNDDINTVQSGVNDLNNPNLMSVIEKQTAAKQFAGLTSQYNVILARAKDDNISTTDLTTAYTNLDTFITPLLKDTTKASNIDRYTYNSLTYAYNTAISKVQTALKDAYNTDISNMYTSVAVASQAASSAAIVASQAATTGDNASHAAEQARIAASQAQSAGNNATSVANNASQAASGAVIAGSQAAAKADKAITAASQAQIAGDNATSVANNATSVANSAKSTADSTYAYANSEINSNSTATAKAQSTADNAFSQAQSVGSRADSEIAVNSMATAKAQSTADNAFSQAQAVGSQASADISSNSTATAKAQSTADNAFSQATTAIDNGKVTSQAVIDLKDGSKLTIAELENGLATKVANSDYASYKEQTASQIGQLVTNGAFSAYQTQTADLIAQKVATSDFSAYQATTAKAIESKVESKDFNTYKTQTADLIDDKVSNSAYASDKTQTASEIADRVSNSAFSTYQTQTASQIASKVDNGDFSTYKTQTANLIGSKVDNGVYQSDKTQTANAISSKVSSSDFNTYKTQTADLIDDKVSNSAYASDKTQTASEIADRVSNSAFSTYQTQTASQIASKVDNGDFSTYKTQTADLISSKVANKDFSAYQATTAKAIESKVESSDFNTYKTQTDSAISSKVESSNFQALQTQVNNSAVGTNLVKDSGQAFTGKAYGFHNYNLASLSELTPGKTYTMSFSAKVDDKAVNCQQNVFVCVYNPSWSWSAAWAWASVPISTNYHRVASTFTVPEGITDANCISVYLSHPVINGNADSSADQSDAAGTGYIKEFKLEEGSVATDWSINPEDQATQSQITQLSGEIDLRVTKGDLVDQINVQAGKTLISSSGQLILSGNSVVLDSVDPVIMKSANIGNMAVGTAQIANGAITDAQIGSLAVGTAQIKDAAISSAKIANLAVGTAQIGDAAITSAKIANLAVGTAQIANAAITDAQVGNVSANKLTAGTIDFNTITGKNINASNITTGKLSTDRLNVDKLSAVSANLGDVTTGSLKGVDIVANTFSTPNGSFTTDSNGNVVASNLTIRGVTNLVYNAALLGGSGSYIPGWGISNNGYYASNMLFDGVPSIGWNNSTGAGVWVNFAQTKLHPLNGATSIPFSASVWFLECGSDTNLQYQFTLAFFDSNSNRINGGFTGNTWNGISSSQGWRYVTIDNVVIPNNATYVGLQFWSYNGHGNACFSSPMLTQTAQATGYQPDVGNIINAGEINGTIINGSTFHGGSIISNSNNTAGYYPMTITPDGSYKSTYFDSAVGLQSSVESGAITYKYRSMTGNGQYLAYDSVINGQGFQSQSGYTSAKDTTFSNPETITGYVNVTPSSGIYLYGPTQQINFAGRSDNIGSNGITMDAYGNIYAQDNSSWWRIGDVNGNQIVNFGIDKAGSNVIEFKRDLWVGNMGLGTAHQIRSKDGHGIYFTNDNSNRVDTYHNNIYYSGSVSKSLLSEKTNVKVADVNYWSNLAMSINLATYNYDTDDYTDPLRLSGIIDDVNTTKEWTLPEAFYARDEDGNIVGIDNGVLLNAVLALSQEQAKQIDKLNTNILAMEAKINGQLTNH